MKFDIEWESYHPDGRKRVRPPASTVHGWLTKMRGTLLDNERIRRAGIKEMEAAKAKRFAVKKQNAARVSAGRPPLHPKVKQPWFRLSFLRQRPQPVGGSRKQSSTAVVRHKGSQSRPKPTNRPSASSRRSARKPDNQVAGRKRSAAHKRSGRPAKRGGKK